MADRRMFSKKVVSSDAFLSMPASAQALYFQLGINADDDGVINNPKTIMLTCGARDDDMNILLAKHFCILIDEASIIVIKHWKINNYIQADRYHPSTYLDIVNLKLISTKNGYTERQKDNCIQSVYKMDTEERLGKVSIGKVSIGESTPAHDDSQLKIFGSLQNVFLTEDEFEKIKIEIPNYDERIEKFSLYLESSGRNYNSHFATIMKFWLEDKNKKSKNQKPDVGIDWLDDYYNSI